LTEQRAQGRKLVLCTAADHSIATAISEHLGIFDEVIASDGNTNLGGVKKADALERLFGAGGFDYVGNASVDLHVWQRARKAVVVNASAEVTRKAKTVAEVDKIFDTDHRVGEALLRALRPHQWAKNFLLFMAPMAAHMIPDGETLPRLLLAFVAFSLCASAVYVANDLLDLGLIAGAYGFTGGGELLDQPVQARGYRILARVPRLSEIITDRLVAHFGGLQRLLGAGIDDLQQVEGVGEARARSVREGLSRIAESSILERFM
jgi:hypothetical protein